MFIFKRERQALRTLQPLLKLAPGAIPVVVCFGVITALFDGLGISLFIPLFQSLTDSHSLPDNGSVIGRLWEILFSQFSPQQVQVFAPLLILLLLVCKNGFLYLNTVIFSRFNWRISHRLRTQIFDQLLHVDSQFLVEQDVGSLMNVLDKEAWQTSQAMATLATLIISICTLTIFSLFLLLTSWRMTLLSLGLLLLVSTGIQTLNRRVKKLGQQATLANMTFVGQGFEQLSGLETVRQFGRRQDEQQRFDQASLQVCSTFMELDQLMGAIAPLSEIAFALLLTFVLLMILGNDNANLSVFITFLFMLYRLSPPIKNLDSARVNLVALTASIQIFTDLMTTTTQRQINSGQLTFTDLQQGIEFHQVSFQYMQSSHPAVNDLSFTIAPGKTTAIVGPSGAGKSTILGLLMRRFDPMQGEIIVDGRPIQEYDLEDWWQSIALVSQNIYLFNRSVRENIAYGCPMASDEEILAAAKMADAHSFISAMSNGYDTMIGERGVRLSGGQRQRLALARCLVRNPKILILDEATNALDSLSEDFIQQTLSAVGQNRTVIIVAHRFSSISQSDHILVVDDGQLVKQGNLDQMMAHDGLFSRLFRFQTIKT